MSAMAEQAETMRWCDQGMASVGANELDAVFDLFVAGTTDCLI